MWMDVAQSVEVERDNRSDDEDTVYDRSGDLTSTAATGKNPFGMILETDAEARGMLDQGDTRCGLGGWRPQFLQRFASKKIFTSVFVFTGVIQGCSWAYFSSTISTMEKRFKMSSETTGALLAGNEVSQLIVAIILAYYGIRSHRMKFVTLGVSLMALSSFLLASPHFVFGSGQYALSFTVPKDEIVYMGLDLDVEEFKNSRRGRLSTTTENLGTSTGESLVSTESSGNGVDEGLTEGENRTVVRIGVLTASNSSLNSTTPLVPTGEGDNATTVEENSLSSSTSSPTSSSSSTEEYIRFPYSYAKDTVTPSFVEELCFRDVEMITNSTERCGMGDSGSSFPIMILFIGQFMAGVGTMLFFSAGGPYMEDIIMPNELPIVFGITLALRLLGPFLGYVIAHHYLQFFISTSSTPSITMEDPRWMGAWWMGWVFIFFIVAISAVLISLFPRQTAKEALRRKSLATESGPPMILLPGSALPLGSAETKIANLLPGYANLYATALLLFQNKVCILLSLSALFNILGGIGYFTFLPKYIEVNFHESSSTAAMFSGSMTIIFQASGLLVSGILLSKLMPNAERLSYWNVIIAAVRVLLLVIVTQFGCDHGEVTFGHTPPVVTNSNELISDVHLLSNCSADCDCSSGPMIPLCDETSGRLFYSPCHAGCEQISDNGTLFAECSCLPLGSTLTSGFCEGHGGCTAGLVMFLIFTAVGEFLASSCVIGKMLIFYRSLVPEGRSLVIGLVLLVISVFAMIPSPIIFGSILDSACHIWENTCANSVGHCWLYNNTRLRYGFNLAAAGLLVLGGCADVVLWKRIKVKDVRLFDGDIDHLPKPSTGTEDDVGA